MKEQILTKFDDTLKKVENLKWLPWIGADYQKTNLLIVGESFYDDGEGWPESDPEAPRSLVKNQGLNSKNPDFSNRKLFDAVEKIILNQDKSSFEERDKIWTSVAYMNQVQRVLENRDSRPNEDDYDISWPVILNVAEIIQPKVILKIGVESIGRLGSLIANGNKEWKITIDGFNTKPERIIGLKKNNLEIKIIAIHHPTGSYGFDVVYWTKIINDNYPEIKELLKK